MDESLPNSTLQKILSERRQTQIEYTYDSVCVKFKNRQKLPVRIEDHGYQGGRT